MDKLEQFIYTGTKTGFNTWGTSADLNKMVDDNISKLYITYREDMNAKIEFSQAVDANPDDYFPIKRKYSRSEEHGTLIMQWNYVGYELYNKKRLGNTFLHGYHGTEINKSPMGCYLQKGFFHKELSDEEKEYAVSPSPLEVVDIPDITDEQKIQELCTFVVNEESIKRLAICLDHVLKSTNPNEHLVFLNVKKGEELWGIIKSISLLLPEEMSVNFTFDTMFYPSEREDCRRFDLLFPRDKIVGFFDGVNDRLFEKSKEFNEEYVMLDMEKSDFGVSYDKEVYEFLKNVFQDKENSKNMLSIYFKSLPSSNGTGFEKMKGAFSSVYEKHKKFPYLSFSDICKLMTSNFSLSRKVIMQTVTDKAKEGIDSIIETSLLLKNEFPDLAEMVTNAAIIVLCDENIINNCVEDILKGNVDDCGKIEKIISQLGGENEFSNAINESISININTYASKIAKSLFNGDSNVSKQIEFIKKYAEPSLNAVGKEFAIVLESEIDNIVQKFVSGDNSYNYVMNVIKTYCQEGVKAVEQGITNYVQKNSKQIAQGLIKENVTLKALYEKLSESDKNVIKNEITVYFQERKNELAEGVINNDKNAKHEINVIDSYVKGITGCIKEIMRGNISNKAEEYANGILNGDKDSMSIYNDFDSEEKEIVNLAIVNVIDKTVNEKLQKLIEGDNSCVAMFKIACETVPGLKAKLVEYIKSFAAAKRADIANGLITEKAVVRKAYEVMLEYTDAVREEVCGVLLRHYEKKKDERMDRFKKDGYAQEEGLVIKWSKICPTIDTTFNSWIREYYFCNENRKATATEYIDKKSVGRFAILKRRIPDFDTLISDTVCDIFKDNLQEIVNEICNGNANKAMTTISKYKQYSSKLNEEELYKELFKQFEDYTVWKDFFVEKSSVTNPVKILVKTPYVNRLKDSYHKYLLSNVACEDGYTIDRGIEFAKKYGVEQIVSEEELYEIVNKYDKSKLNDSILKFISKRVNDSKGVGNAEVSETAYEMIFNDALSNATTREQIVSVLEKYTKIDTVDALVKVFASKTEIDSETAYEIFDKTLGDLSYSIAIDKLIVKDKELALRYYEDYVFNKIEGNVIIEVLKQCKENVSYIHKHKKKRTVLINSLDESDVVSSFVELIKTVDDAEMRTKFLKDYLREVGLANITNKNGKELITLFENNTVQYRLLSAYLDLFGRVTPIGINWEETIKEAFIDDFKEIDEKKMKLYENFQDKITIAIVENVITENIDLEYADLLKIHFGKNFTFYLLLYAIINKKNKGVEKRLYQFLDVAKKKKIVEAEEISYLNEFDSEMCGKIAERMGLKSDVDYLTFNNKSEVTIKSEIVDIIKHSKNLTNEAVGTVVDYLQRNCRKEDLSSILYSLMVNANLSELSKDNVKKLINLTSYMEKGNTVCNANLQMLNAVMNREVDTKNYSYIFCNDEIDEVSKKITRNFVRHIYKLEIESSRRRDEKISEMIEKNYKDSYFKAIYDNAKSTITTKDCLRGLEMSINMLYNKDITLYKKLISNIECLEKHGNKKFEKAIK